MSAIKEMYSVLEQMVESAARGDKQRVLELNKDYNALVPKVYHAPPIQSDLEYDNCRISCVTSVGILEHLREQLVLDARERFSKIPKPNR